MFKTLLNTIRAKVTGGSIDNKGNYYSRKDDEKLAGKQTRTQLLQTANPQKAQAKPQPNVARPNELYAGVMKPTFLEALKNIVQPSVTTKKVLFDKPRPIAGKVLAAEERVPSPTPTPTPDLKDWNNFEKYIADQARARGYHPGVIVSQKAIESSRGQSRFAKERNNYGGMGAYDSNPNNAFSYASPEAYLDSYFNLIETRYPKAYQNRKDPKKYAHYLKEGGYASDPNYEWKLQNTPEFRKYSR